MGFDVVCQASIAATIPFGAFQTAHNHTELVDYLRVQLNLDEYQESQNALAVLRRRWLKGAADGLDDFENKFGIFWVLEEVLPVREVAFFCHTKSSWLQGDSLIEAWAKIKEHIMANPSLALPLDTDDPALFWKCFREAFLIDEYASRIRLAIVSASCSNYKGRDDDGPAHVVEPNDIFDLAQKIRNAFGQTVQFQFHLNGRVSA
jgi:hypothetical protein